MEQRDVKDVQFVRERSMDVVYTAVESRNKAAVEKAKVTFEETSRIKEKAITVQRQ